MSKEKELNMFPTSSHTNNPHNVKEATEVLAYWGLSSNEKKTRELINKGKLEAEWSGNEGDRRAGYVVHGRDIYNYIVAQIPPAKLLIKEHYELQKIKAKEGKGKKKNEKTTPSTEGTLFDEQE